MNVIVQAPVKPTEDPEKVKEAVLRFFPNAQIQEGPQGILATAPDLDAFRARIWELRIIDTVRGQLLHYMRPGSTVFRLSKQAALAGIVSFPPTPHVLGDVTVRIEEDDVERLIWWLCPETKDGEIVAGQSS